MRASASDRNFDGREAHRGLRNFFAVGQTIFDVEADGIPNIFDSLFVALALTVAAWSERQETKYPSASGSMTMGKVIFFIRLL